jgi:hypothetical protein
MSINAVVGMSWLGTFLKFTGASLREKVSPTHILGGHERPCGRHFLGEDA